MATAQTSLLYVNNPGFIYDEVAVVGELAFTQVNHVDPRRIRDLDLPRLLDRIGEAGLRPMSLPDAA